MDHRQRFLARGQDDKASVDPVGVEIVPVAEFRRDLADSDALAATTSGTIRITNGRDGGLIQGDLTVPNARYQIIRQGQAEVPELTGVRRRSEIRVARPTDRPAPPKPAGLFRLDLRVRANNQLFVSGMGLESEWEMDLRVGGTSAAPTINGGLDLVRGTYSFAGKRFDVNRGTVRFRGGALTDPDINIQATTTTDGITAVINVTGTGLVVINPPWTLYDRLAEALPWLVEKLGDGPAAELFRAHDRMVLELQQRWRGRLGRVHSSLAKSPGRESMTSRSGL